MKRYDTKITVTDPPFPGTLTFGEMKEGRFVYHADLHAWALKHKQTVEGMRHGPLCDDDCPRCVALREIEEIINGN